MVVNYDATARQKAAITKLCVSLGIKTPIEEKPMTSGEAGRLYRELYARLRAQRKLASKGRAKGGDR